MIKARSMKLVRPAKGRMERPSGRPKAGKPLPGETFRQFIRTLEKLDRDSAKQGGSAKGEGAR